MSLLFICWFVIHFNHAIYISVTELVYSGAEAGELNCRVFNDDLEDAIFYHSGKRVSLRTTEEVENQSALIASYISEKIKVVQGDGQPARLVWESGTAENDSVWASFSIEAGPVVRIENRLLLELFPTQQNVVTLSRAGQKSYFRFTKEQPSQAVSD